jgi:hypothetical protein
MGLVVGRVKGRLGRFVQEQKRAAGVDKVSCRSHLLGTMSAAEVTVNFEQKGSQLSAVEIGHSNRSPRVAALHSALFALGVVISSYHVKASSQGYVERMVIARRDGGAIEGQLTEATRAAILPIALQGDAEQSTS